MTTSRPIHNSNFQYLRLAAYIFNQEKVEDGKRVFSLICHDPRHDEWGVYHFMWIVKNSPSGIDDYGRKCFHDLSGLSSTGREKALAIHRHLTARGVAAEFVPSPSLEAFFIRTGILSVPAGQLSRMQILSVPSDQLSINAEEDQIDWDLIKMIGGAAATAIGILVTAGGVIMMLGSGGSPRELPSLAGHITAGGGHIALRDTVQSIGSNLPSILSSNRSVIGNAERHFHSLPTELNSSSVQPIASMQPTTFSSFSTPRATGLSPPLQPSISLTPHVSVGSGHFQQTASIGDPLIQGRDLVKECRAHVAPPIQGWDRNQARYIEKIKDFEKTIKKLHPKDSGRLFYHFEYLVKEKFFSYLDNYFNELQEIINNFKKSKYENLAFKVRAFVERGNLRS